MFTGKHASWLVIINQWQIIIKLCCTMALNNLRLLLSQCGSWAAVNRTGDHVFTLLESTSSVNSSCLTKRLIHWIRQWYIDNTVLIVKICIVNVTRCERLVEYYHPLRYTICCREAGVCSPCGQVRQRSNCISVLPKKLVLNKSLLQVYF